MEENKFPNVIKEKPSPRKNIACALVFKNARIAIDIKIKPKIKRMALNVYDIIFSPVP